MKAFIDMKRFFVLFLLMLYVSQTWAMHVTVKVSN